MRLRVPDYYDTFHCIADQCKHSCCATNWEIDIDEETYKQYCELETEFGEKLRKSIKKDKQIHFKLKHGKCPFLSKEHLCQVYQTLGEQSMCRVCTVYPRFEERYGDRIEKTLGLSCEEVGRIVFTHPEPICFIEREIAEPIEMKTPKEEKVEKYDRRQIEKARREGIRILQDRKQSLNERFSLFLLFCNEIQRCIDENQISSIDEVIDQFELGDVETTSKGQKVSEVPVHTLFMQRMDIMMDMEVVEEDWGEEMNNVERAFYEESRKRSYDEMARKLDLVYPQVAYQYEHIMVYFADLYLIQAIYDGDFLGAAKYSLLAYLTIRDMDVMKCLIRGGQFSLEDRIEVVRLFCKQVQHSAQSEKYLKEKIAAESVFSLEALQRQVSSYEEEVVRK